MYEVGTDDGEPRIAVIAVHGVADQSRFSSARSVSDLLLRLEENGRSRYGSFCEERVRIPVAPTVVANRGPHIHKRGLFGTEERPEFVIDALRQGSGMPGSRSSWAHLFMREQLSGHRSDCQPYETICLKSQRKNEQGPDGSRGPHVHVYESFWADLSRAGNWILSLLAELYQIVLHLPNLGRLNLELAQLENPGSVSWRWCARLQLIALRLLTLVLPILGLLMTIAALIALPGRLPEAAKWWSAMGAFAVLMIGITGFIAYRAAIATRFPRMWASLSFGVGIVAFTLVYAFPKIVKVVTTDQLLAWVLLIASGLPMELVLRVLERVRPGAIRLGRTLFIGTFAALAVFVGIGKCWQHIVDGSLKVIEGLVLLGALTSLTFYVSSVTTVILGAIAVRSATGSEEKRHRERRVMWTVRGTLALSYTLLALISLLLAAALNEVAEERHLLPTAVHHPLFPLSVDAKENGIPQQNVIHGILASASTSALPVVLAVVLALLVIVLWALLPSIWAEWKPQQDATGERSERLGRWLSASFPVMAAGITVLFWTVILVWPAIALVRLIAHLKLSFQPHWLLGVKSLLDWLAGVTEWFVWAAGALIVGTATGLAAAKRLNNLALGFRPVLDVALDVDNYLREHPGDDTPRARMAERLVSLLRYLCRWRDVCGRPYNAIIFVAHSQGSVLTADTLAFLQHESDPELRETPPLYLFTMGSPLRQIYGRCFPHLYDWVGADKMQGSIPHPGKNLRPQHCHVVRHLLRSDALPDPGELGVKRWVNAYRSGDYVGRALWRTETVDSSIYRVMPSEVADGISIEVSEDAARSRRELCIGAGAHTHYWDESAGAIGEELDLLVQEASRQQ